MPRHNFTCKDGRKVSIEIDEETYAADVTSDDGADIGRMEFAEDDRGLLKVVWANLDKQKRSYVRQGIGRECLRLLKKAYNKSITASENDGLRSGDGSHLTGDAPGFVQKMREEGLILYLDPRDEEEG